MEDNGIQASHATGLVIENLTIADMYDQDAPDNVGNTGAGSSISVYTGGSNILIQNNTLHDAGDGVFYAWNDGDTNFQLANNNISRVGWSVGCNSPGSTLNSIYIYGNHFHDNYNWGNGKGATHINFIHCYQTGGGGIQNFYYYNNLHDGNMGPSSYWTAPVYLESDGAGSNWNTSTGTAYVWNNVFYSNGVGGNGIFQDGSGVGDVIYNNYFYGTYGGGPCFEFGKVTNITIENNVFQSCGQIFNSAGATTWVAIDYNIYAYSSNGNPLWQVGNISTSSFKTWQADCNCDAHSQAQLGSALADITTEGVPSAGYMGAQQGANLTGAATGSLAALDLDMTSTRRPGGTCSTLGSSSCWDIGAYQVASGGSAPAPPTGLTVLVQ